MDDADATGVADDEDDGVLLSSRFFEGGERENRPSKEAPAPELTPPLPPAPLELAATLSPIPSNSLRMDASAASAAARGRRFFKPPAGDDEADPVGVVVGRVLEEAPAAAKGAPLATADADASAGAGADAEAGDGSVRVEVAAAAAAAALDEGCDATRRGASLLLLPLLSVLSPLALSPPSAD